MSSESVDRITVCSHQLKRRAVFRFYADTSVFGASFVERTPIQKILLHISADVCHFVT